MSHQSTTTTVATIGIDAGKNAFHLVGLDQRGNIVLQLKTSRAQLERRLANVPSCLVGMEACSGTHHVARQLEALGHDVQLSRSLILESSSCSARPGHTFWHLADIRVHSVDVRFRG